MTNPHTINASTTPVLHSDSSIFSNSHTPKPSLSAAAI